MIEGARKELRAVARELSAIRYRLLGVVATLPPREDEATTEEDIAEEYDAITEMRAAAQSAIRDGIEPAILSLESAEKLLPLGPKEDNL